MLLPHSTEPLAPLLKEALRRHQTEIVDALLKGGADVNARDAAGFTPLHDAALAGDTGAVRLLLDHGANVNIGDKDSGATALYMAATMGREDAVKLLLEKGADPKIGPSPVKAAQAGGFDKIAEAIKAK
jgi:ankyrin repeat protein